MTMIPPVLIQRLNRDLIDMNHLDDHKGTRLAFLRPLKVAVIREEYVALTGGPLKALVLNQFIYWTQRVQDFDQFILEEQQRNPECNIALRHGWIYKKAQDLIEETMCQLSEVSMRRIIKYLVEQGWVDEQSGSDKWNKTLQYRVNLVKIQSDLHQLGYPLSGFALLPSSALVSHKSSKLQNEGSKLHGEGSKLQIEASELQKSSFIYRTEITPEIILNKLSPTSLIDNHAREGDVSELVANLIEIWNTTLSEQLSTQPHESRKQRLLQLFTTLFNDDTSQWQAFCSRVARTPFLRGSGPNKWQASLDWCLHLDHAHRILEGQYGACRDDQPVVNQDNIQTNSEADIQQELCAQIEAEPDPVVRNFKTQLLHYAGVFPYQHWLRDVTVDSQQGHILTVSVPTPLVRSYCRERLHHHLLNAAKDSFVGIRTVDVLCAEISSVPATVVLTQASLSPIHHSPAGVI